MIRFSLLFAAQGDVREWKSLLESLNTRFVAFATTYSEEDLESILDSVRFIRKLIKYSTFTIYFTYFDVRYIAMCVPFAFLM